MTSIYLVYTSGNLRYYTTPPWSHGPQPARENDRERFELLGIIKALPGPSAGPKFKQIPIQNKHLDRTMASCRIAAGLPSRFFSVRRFISFPFNGIALPPLRDRLSCGSAATSASLASQDLKIEIISAPLPLRHGDVYRKLQRPR